MKENIFYWIRVLILAGILLFILISCTAWAQPVSGISPRAISEQIKNSTLPANHGACLSEYAWNNPASLEFPVFRQSPR